jgi:hypothetical protein
MLLGDLVKTALPNRVVRASVKFSKPVFGHAAECYD